MFFSVYVWVALLSMQWCSAMDYTNTTSSSSTIHDYHHYANMTANTTATMLSSSTMVVYSTKPDTTITSLATKTTTVSRLGLEEDSSFGSSHSLHSTTTQTSGSSSGENSVAATSSLKNKAVPTCGTFPLLWRISSLFACI